MYGAVVVFLFMCGCAKQPAPSRAIDDATSRTLVLEQLNTFREMFNSGRCESIYDEASHEFKSHKRENWNADCEELRKLLGAWDTFDVQSLSRCKFRENAMCVDGIGAFSTGGWKLQVASEMEHGYPRLLFISLLFKSMHGEDVVIRYPHSYPRPQLLDPPQQRPWAKRAS